MTSKTANEEDEVASKAMDALEGRDLLCARIILFFCKQRRAYDSFAAPFPEAQEVRLDCARARHLRGVRKSEVASKYGRSRNGSQAREQNEKNKNKAGTTDGRAISTRTGDKQKNLPIPFHQQETRKLLK